MVSIGTYVFFDMETTGIPKEEGNRTKITELSMVAVKRDHLLETRPGVAPRVQNKLTLCFNPIKPIQPSCTDVTGLSNDLLEYETVFNMNAYNLIIAFLEVLRKPIYLVAHNGNNFDFPILKRHIEILGVNLPEDVFVADSYYAFYDILSSPQYNENVEELNKETEHEEGENNGSKFIEETTVCDKDATDNLSNVNVKETSMPLQLMSPLETLEQAKNNMVQIQNENERTPKQVRTSTARINHTPTKSISKRIVAHSSRRKFPWSDGKKPNQSYKLKHIYERVMRCKPIEAHRAENDCIIMLEVAVALSKAFVQWVDINHTKFSDVKPMTVGVPLGLLFLTAALWGCTNPFIKQGTKGLRAVRAKTTLGQIYAEFAFLLGNWRYVVPWLVNQAGSLVYLVAVQSAPLSLAVPTANSLAFAFTALTGAILGIEQPLDRTSILGVVLVAVGTALCCLDTSDNITT